MEATAAKFSTNDADREEKGDLSSSSSINDGRHGVLHSSGKPTDGAITSEKSRGVIQMEQLNSRIGLKYRILLYGGFAILAYVMSLDQYTNGTYLNTAVSVSFSAHSTLATISSIKSVFQAVSQPPIAKIADVWGRLEAYAICVSLYALGYIVVASAQSVYAYAAGASINVLGITGLFLLQNIIISDISSLRNRLFWSIFPSIPGTINVWISGNVTQSLLGSKNESANLWRWGIGMFCILTPVLAIPIMITLGVGMRKSNSNKLQVVAPTRDQSEREHLTKWQKVQSIFWQLDFVGLLLLVAGAGMVLVTITIANGKGSRWSDAHCIALLVVGGTCCSGFVLWQRYGARHPLIPFHLLTNRTVIICLILALIHPVASSVIGGYFYTFLVVAADQTTLSATRIRNISSFSSTLVVALNGLLVRYIRYLKPIVVAGFVLEVLAFGLMIRFRQSDNSQAEIALVQLVRGIAAGCIGFPLQASIQSVTKHEHLGAITAGYLTIYYLAGGVGSAIAGIWTNTVPNKIREYMGNDTLAAQAYANPFGFATKYAFGTPERMAVARAHDETQRIMCITATCIAAVGLLISLGLQNVKLTDEQSLDDAQLDKLSPNKAAHRQGDTATSSVIDEKEELAKERMEQTQMVYQTPAPGAAGTQ